MKPDTDIQKRLKNIKAFVIDQDGTAYLEQQTFPWTLPFLKGLAERKIRYLFLSNNSSKSREQHRLKLASIGIDVGYRQILSSGDATIEHLKSLNNGKDIYLLATPAVENDFIEAGFNIDSPQPRYVVLAYDLTLTFDKLEKACNLIRTGVEFIATHQDNTWIIAPGKYRPDVGALSAAITAATDVKPIFIGKPNTVMVKTFLDRLQLSKEEVVIVGDRLNIDIRMGCENDILSFLVLSGQTKKEDIPGSTWQPDFVVEKTTDILSFFDF